MHTSCAEPPGQKTEAFILFQFADVHRRLGDHKQALRELARSRRLFDAVHDIRGRARTFVREGDVYRDLGQWEQSISRLNACFPVFEKLGDRWWAAVVLHGFGQTYLKMGQLDEAMRCLDRCIPVFRELGSPREAAARKDRQLALASATENLRPPGFWHQLIRRPARRIKP
jgi:tetratricopeptide (TPR) repeat protein